MWVIITNHFPASDIKKSYSSSLFIKNGIALHQVIPFLIWQTR
jgi:hypothetical protein